MSQSKRGVSRQRGSGVSHARSGSQASICGVASVCDGPVMSQRSRGSVSSLLSLMCSGSRANSISNLSIQIENSTGSVRSNSAVVDTPSSASAMARRNSGAQSWLPEATQALDDEESAIDYEPSMDLRELSCVSSVAAEANELSP